MITIKRLLLPIFALLILGSCSKEDLLEVDMHQYNSDNPANSELDKWILSSLTDPYNVEVIYRYNRNLTDVSKDIAPPKLDRIQPVMEAVLNLYLKPYEDLVGKSFIKTYAPKQYVLYGSVSYNSNGSVTLGTADGGRKVVLYDVNNFSVDDIEGSAGVRRKLRTIHHEFTHILNQNIPIPPEFQEITKADYDSDWTGSSNTAEKAKELGFVSRYARSQYTEDFAEMTAHLLIHGQVWFDNYVFTSTPDAQEKLRKKEEQVVQYFKTAFNIDFRELQNEINQRLKDIYGANDPADLNSFAAWLETKSVGKVVVDLSNSIYDQYGISDVFKQRWLSYKADVDSRGRFPTYMQFNFNSDVDMRLEIEYLNSSGGSFFYYYDFDMEVNAETKEVKFIKKHPEGDTGAHGNGQLAHGLPGFEAFWLPYLTENTFIAEWLPYEIDKDHDDYRSFGGFYVKDNPEDYFYGNLE